MGDGQRPGARSAPVVNQDFEEKINSWLALSKNDEGHLKAGDYMGPLLPYIEIESISRASPPTVTYAFTVQPDHCNRMGSLHGGAAATIFDFCTTMVLAGVGRPGFWQLLGVSRALNVTYFRPALCDEKVLVECEILQVGKRMASLRGTMRRRRDGQVLSTCMHEKANTDPDPNL